jgi:hypothetical protein
MRVQIDIGALVNFVETTLDYSPDYEDDAFAFDFEGQRIYCERKRRCFDLHIGAEVLQLPR